MRVGLIGLGTVGSAVACRLRDEARLLAERAGTPVELAAAAVRDPGRTRDVDLGATPITGDALALARDGSLDVVVELMGGLHPAQEVIEAALSAGHAVVTANKAVLARHGPRLAAAAGTAALPFRFEAAVGGGIPVIALLLGSLLGDRIDSVEAVINGTTNFVLGRMASTGQDLDTAVAEAQARGYAEADPASDIDGEDAACKLSIISWLAFGAAVTPEQVDTEGIRGVASIDVGCGAAMGHAVKLVARARRSASGLCLRVGPALVPHGHPLAPVEGANSGLILTGDLLGPLTLRGAGAGGDATASAVVSDIVAACRALTSGARPDPLPPAAALPVLDGEECDTAAYLRVATTKDPEAAATISLMLEDRGVPVESTAPGPGPGDLLVLTAAAPRAVLDRALETLDTLPMVEGVAARLDRLTVS